MAQSLAELLADTKSILDVQRNREQLSRTRLEDVEEMAPHTPWRDFLTETLLDPTQYLTGAAMGAGFAAKLGRPALATALEWADPLLGGSKAIGRMFEGAPGKWPVGARMGGIVGRGGGRGREVLPQEMIGTPGREPAGLLETGPLEMGPSSLPTPGPLAVRPPVSTEGRTLGEMFPLGMRRPAVGELPRATFEMPPSSMAHGELSEDVVNLSNSFTRQFRQPIDELVEAADKVIGRNRLVREAEKLLRNQEPMLTTYRVGADRGVSGTFYGTKMTGPRARGATRGALPIRGEGIVHIAEPEVEGTSSSAPLADFLYGGIKLDPKLKRFIQTNKFDDETWAADTAAALALKQQGVNVIHFTNPKTGATVSVDLRMHTEDELWRSLQKAVDSEGEDIDLSFKVWTKPINLKTATEPYFKTSRRILEQTKLNEEFLKKGKFTQGSPIETKFKVGDFIEFTDEKGKVIKGKIRDIDELSETAEVFTDRAKLENPNRASEEVFLGRIQEPTGKELKSKKNLSEIPIKVYTGSDEPFTRFDVGRIGKRTDPGFAGRGAYTTTDIEKASRWGKNVLETEISPNSKFIKIDKISELYERYGLVPLTETERNLPKAQRDRIYTSKVNDFAKKMLETGYEGVEWRLSTEDTQYVLFSPENYSFKHIKR